MTGVREGRVPIHAVASVCHRFRVPGPPCAPAILAVERPHARRGPARFSTTPPSPRPTLAPSRCGGQASSTRVAVKMQQGVVAELLKIFFWEHPACVGLLMHERVETSNRVPNPYRPFLAVSLLMQSSSEVRECGGTVADRRTAVAAVGAVADLVTTAKAALL